ncbi:MAG: hydroxyacid dehydrogenase [Chloroflexi bacterium]|nr:hydroxyacid dehydrogenase [Chloroflexota bacterium]MCI0850636.1 hydroxyacid dehydrogenase [Chloroflexota bacterium]
MTGNRPQVGLASTAEVREKYVDDKDLERLYEFADFRWQKFEEQTSWDTAPEASENTRAEFTRFAAELDALIVCHGSPRVDESVLASAPRLALVGELEGDRFAQRIDVEAAIARGVRAVDTTHGSSYPVSEWALGMMLIGLRSAGAHFRRLITGELWGTPEQRETAAEFAQNEELTGRTVGLIGAGYIGRRLIELLKPFDVKILAHDPYIAPELASPLGFTLTSLDKVLSEPDVVVCLAPLTPGTKGMLGRDEISRLKPGAVFVNVSRGAIVDSEALIERLEVGDIVACLDVFDPEPIPVGARVRDLPNVFLSPHIAGTTQRSRPRFFAEMVSELERHFSGYETHHNLTARTLANRRGK